VIGAIALQQLYQLYDLDKISRRSHIEIYLVRNYVASCLTDVTTIVRGNSYMC